MDKGDHGGQSDHVSTASLRLESNYMHSRMHIIAC